VTWLTHTTFAYSTAYIIGLNPVVAMIGSTAPDWSEDFLGVKEHRGVTHYLTIWVFGLIVSFTFFFLSPDNLFISAVSSFVYGGFTHILLDSLTVSGVPLGKGNIRIRIGGLIKTGGLSEYVFLIVFIFAVSPFILSGSTFNFYSSKNLYQRGIIDKKEYEELKFKFF